MTQTFDEILDEMGAEIRALRESIMAQNILSGAYKRYIKDIEKENAVLKSKIKRVA